jgi:hypothetical protein
MKRLILLLVTATIWTYGSETMDILMTQDIEYVTFMKLLGCKAKNNIVICVVDGVTYTSIGGLK